MQQMTCPQCERQLWVSDGTPTFGWLCAECKAENTYVETEGHKAAEPCPRCGHMVEGVWLFCPRCEAVLHGPDRGSRGGRFDDLVHRRSSRVSAILVLMSVAGVLGLGWSGLMSLTAFSHGAELPLIAWLAILVVLAVASFGIMVYQTRENPSQRSIGRVIVGTLAIAGGLTTFACTLGAVGFIYAFAACVFRL
jgi:DNA-directed RNA polymerase subunit RPC12/RpoP